MKKIIIIVTDRVKGIPRRGCYWDSNFLSVAEREPMFISIQEEILAKKNPAIELFHGNHDEMIINWDAINGDPVYGSDISQAFFKHYNTDLFLWLRKGKLLLVESQRAAEEACKDAYQSVSPQLVPQITIANFHGLSVSFAESDQKFTAVGKERDGLFTPHGELKSLEDRICISGTLFRGCFQKVKKPWIPILYGINQDGNRKPVAITLPISGGATCGALILTTLHIAEANAGPIIKYLLDLRLQISTLMGKLTKVRRKAFLSKAEEIFIKITAEYSAAMTKGTL